MTNIIAAIVATLGANEPPAYTQCATIDKGGYHIFADPSCPQLRGNTTGDEPRTVAGVEES